MTLTEFLLARIAEDDAAATVRMTEIEAGLAVGPGATVVDLPNWSDENGSWGRGRVLLEGEAKRAIVELHNVVVVSIPAYGTAEGVTFVEPDSFEDITTRRLMCSTCHNIGAEGPCETLRALALPYSDHPDFLEEWRSST